MAPRLLNRIACITGSSSGIGRAIALAYASEGALIMCSDLQLTARNESSLVPTHELIVKEGGKAMFWKADVSSEEEVVGLIAETVRVFGRLDIMVNNAGIAPEVSAQYISSGLLRLHETPTQTYDLVQSVNSRGVFLGCKHAITQFLAQEPLSENDRGERTKGWIVNLASVGGIVGLYGGSSYTASKHAVMGLTKMIAVEYANERIHCNAVCPGYVDTAMISTITQESQESRESSKDHIVISATSLKAAHPWNSLGKPEDIAKAAVFLASDDASWVTGHGLVVDGGYLAR